MAVINNGIDTNVFKHTESNLREVFGLNNKFIILAVANIWNARKGIDDIIKLGDYLIVGVTTENFDITRGKINVRQSLMERMEAVRKTGIADEVIPEEYVGQKIDDIIRNNVSIFALGSDWEGKFDYLNEYCKVVYLPRTEGVSSSQIRSDKIVNIGIAGSDPTVLKLTKQAENVNGIRINGIYCEDTEVNLPINKQYVNFENLILENDAVYVAVRPEIRYSFIKKALENGRHVISESPIAMSEKQAQHLYEIAKSKNLQLFDSIKTAYALPFQRLILLIKSGIIGDIKNIDVTCTSLEVQDWLKKTKYYTSFTGWGSIALLPLFKILGIDYENISFMTLNSDVMQDIYTKATFKYKNAMATVNVGVGVKSEGDLRISGTKGYIYVPAPWWKSGYFEVRFEDLTKNKPYFYENDGEGLRMELVQFVRCITNNERNHYLDSDLSVAICKIMAQYKISLENF